jgi:hypothetical protein
VTASNFIRFTNSHTLQFTRAHTYVSSACCVFTSRGLVTASNGGLSPYSGFPYYPRASATSFSQQPLTTAEPQQSSDFSQLVPLITSRHGPRRKHRLPLLSFRCRCLATGLHATILCLVEFTRGNSLQRQGFGLVFWRGWPVFCQRLSWWLSWISAGKFLLKPWICPRTLAAIVYSVLYLPFIYLFVVYIRALSAAVTITSNYWIRANNESGRIRKEGAFPNLSFYTCIHCGTEEDHEQTTFG